MNLIEDARKFAQLSDKYRVQPDVQTMKEIKELVNMNAERIAQSFKLTLDIKESSFARGHGVPMIGLSMANIIKKGASIRRNDITTLNTRSRKQINGVNILLDYSGSMWASADDCKIADIRRIHCQNFFALCLGVYIQRMSRGAMKILYTSVANHPIFLVDTDNMQTADWDNLIIHSKWSDENLAPPFKHSIRCSYFDYFNEIYPYGSFESSYAEFKKNRYTNFLTLIVTDGGLQRSDESRADRTEFMKKLIHTIATDGELVFWQFIQLDERYDKMGTETVELVRENAMYCGIVNTPEEYNLCFDYLSHLINQMVRETR